MPRSARCIAVFSIAVLLLTSGLTCQASAPEPAAAAYVLMEADSGRVLYENGAFFVGEPVQYIYRAVETNFAAMRAAL